MSLATDSLIPSQYYLPEILSQERARVFEQNWVFVGFSDDLSSPNDFITKTIGNTPIVVQNIAGELYALLNVCSHRKATIQSQAKGNRALRCPYHCWSYGAKGKLQSVPQDRSDFALSAEQREKLALKSFSLERCGRFLFVRISEQGEDLRSYLGEFFAPLADISMHFTDAIDDGRYQWKTNWKLAVETVLEVYHVPGTHPESFVKLAKPSCEIQRHNKHNTGHTPLQETPKKWWAGVRKHLKLQQFEALTEYNHFFIYPNLAIGLTNGSLMSLQSYDPVDETHSVLSYHLKMAGRVDGNHTKMAVKAAVQDNFTSFNHTTLEEDRVVAESCQQNMRVNEQPGLLGVCEGRISHFHQNWRFDMGLDNN